MSRFLLQELNCLFICWAHISRLKEAQQNELKTIDQEMNPK